MPMLNVEVAQFLEPGRSLAFSIRSARSMAPFDFASGQFLAPGGTPTLAVQPMGELPPPYGGAYAASYPTTAAVFWEPLYLVTVHDLGDPDPATGVRPAPQALFTYDVPFSKGSSTYSAPPLRSW